MLTEFLINVLSTVWTWGTAWLPTSIPALGSVNFYDNLESVFRYMKLIMGLPILRVFVQYFWWWFAIWLVLYKYNLVLTLLSIVPFLSGLKRLRIKTHRVDEKKE